MSRNINPPKIPAATKDERKLEEHLLDENLDVSVEKHPDWARRLYSAFPALGNRNYRLYFIGQFISLVGTWLQIVAQGWLVLELTNSAFLIGLVAAAGTLPALLFSLHAGVIVDRFPKKKLLQFTQVASLILAFVLGILVTLHAITVFEIAVLAFLLGIVNAIDLPARQAFVVEIVDRSVLASAIALNAGMFNAARVIGPGVAGFLIAFVGTGGAFNLNGISYVAAIAALFYIQLREAPLLHHRGPVWPAIKEGIRYSFGHPIIRTLILFTGVSSVFGWSYSTILPFIAYNTFHVGAAGLGYLYAATGLGAVAAAVFVSLYFQKISSGWFILGGNTIFAAGLVMFSLTQSFPMALCWLFVSGVGLLLQFSTMNTVIHNLVRDDIRGRVMSIYLLMFVGLFPLGNLQIGYLAERFGAGFAIRIGAVIVFLCGAMIFAYRNRIREEMRRYSLKTEA